VLPRQLRACPQAGRRPGFRRAQPPPGRPAPAGLRRALRPHLGRRSSRIAAAHRQPQGRRDLRYLHVGRERRPAAADARRLQLTMPPPLNAAAGFAVLYRPFPGDDLPFVTELYASTRRGEVATTGWPPEMQE